MLDPQLPLPPETNYMHYHCQLAVTRLQDVQVLPNYTDQLLTYG